MRISAVINTHNEEENIERCLEALDFVSEIVVVDMESSDATRKKALKFTKKVFNHPLTGFVEPARNFAIDKAKSDWILIVDADEIISPELARTLMKLTDVNEQSDFYRLPRKNIVFGKWIKHGLWWPDYQVRFFKRGKVEWKEEIHSVPFTRGVGRDLDPTEQNAILHLHYYSISKYLDRLNRYTTQQAKELSKSHSAFHWQDIINKPVDEFLRRYFLSEGFKDGLHGLTLALLQAFSEFIVVCKCWEIERFPEIPVDKINPGVQAIAKEKGSEINYWIDRQNKSQKILSLMLRKLFS